MPGKARLSQEQFLYQMVKRGGVKPALVWFKEKGKKAAWGGTNMALAQQLIEDGMVDEGLSFMELEVELNSGKVWLLRKTAEAYLSNGRPEKALEMVKQGLALKPDDEKLQTMKIEVGQDMRKE